LLGTDIVYFNSLTQRGLGILFRQLGVQPKKAVGATPEMERKMRDGWGVFELPYNVRTTYFSWAQRTFSPSHGAAPGSSGQVLLPRVSPLCGGR